jgi:hypothetical protein
LHTIDLSASLFPSLETLADVVAACPNLSRVDANGTTGLCSDGVLAARQLTPEAIAAAIALRPKLQHLQVLSLNHVPAFAAPHNGARLALLLLACPGLSELHIADCGLANLSLTAAEAAIIPEPSGLNRLFVNDNPFTLWDSVLPPISLLVPSLLYLSLADTLLPDIPFASVAGPDLSALSAYDTPATLPAVAPLPRLQALSLAGCRHISSWETPLALFPPSTGFAARHASAVLVTGASDAAETATALAKAASAVSRLLRISESPPVPFPRLSDVMLTRTPLYGMAPSNDDPAVTHVAVAEQARRAIACLAGFSVSGALRLNNSDVTAEETVFYEKWLVTAIADCNPKADGDRLQFPSQNSAASDFVHSFLPRSRLAFALAVVFAAKYGLTVPAHVAEHLLAGAAPKEAAAVRADLPIAAAVVSDDAFLHLSLRPAESETRTAVVELKVPRTVTFLRFRSSVTAKLNSACPGERRLIPANIRLTFCNPLNPSIHGELPATPDRGTLLEYFGVQTGYTIFYEEDSPLKARARELAVNEAAAARENAQLRHVDRVSAVAAAEVDAEKAAVAQTQQHSTP